MTAEPHALAPGDAGGEVLRLDEPLSFWGGIDPATGAIIEPRHPQLGERITGRVLVMPAGRGSSSSSTVLAEAIRAGNGPAAIVLAQPDGIVVLGSIVARELYGIAVPVVVAPSEAATGDHLRLRAAADGSAELTTPPPT